MAERIAFSSISPTFDSNATAFITATGITDFIQRIAINELVLDLKRFGLWDKCIAIYPFIGGTADTHKWNLKDPRDLDAAFRLVFSGGWVHSATGALPNGTTGYADTFIVPSVALSLNNTHISFYSRTSNAAAGLAEMGSRNATPNFGYVFLGTRYSGNLFYGDINSESQVATTSNNSSGFFIASRTASNVRNLFVNGVSVLGSTTPSSALNSFPITIGGFNAAGTITQFSNRECAFATIGLGLTDTDVFNLYTSIQKFQGYLNRAVN